MKTTRGFTMIELLVGMTVGLLVIGVVMATFLSQQRAMQALDLSREASNAGRDAMLSLQETIGRAGYGIDPRYAFDFRNYNCPTYSATAPCRDSVNSPDQMVFVERDPNYYWAGTPSSTVQGCCTTTTCIAIDSTAACTGHAWQVTAFDTTHVTINTNNANDTFLVGQTVLMTCAKGLNPTMGTVNTLAKASNVGGVNSSLQLTLTAASTTNPYKNNIAAGHDPCFDSLVGVSMFLVNRYRFFITTLPPITPGQTLPEPWLMLDRGLDYNQNGTTPENTGSGSPDTNDLIPIAHGVEGLQIAYLYQPSTTGLAAQDNNTNWIVGDNPSGTPEEPTVDPTAVGATTGNTSTGPTQTTADTDPLRFNTNAANIRGVRVRIVVRSLNRDITQPLSWLGDPATPPGATTIEDRSDFTAVNLGQFRRYFSSVAVATPNLRSKDPFIF